MEREATPGAPSQGLKVEQPNNTRLRQGKNFMSLTLSQVSFERCFQPAGIPCELLSLEFLRQRCGATNIVYCCGLSKILGSTAGLISTLLTTTVALGLPSAVTSSWKGTLTPSTVLKSEYSTTWVVGPVGLLP